MRTLVTGSSGLVGSRLVSALTAEGHEVKRLVRTEPHDPDTQMRWDPQAGWIDPARLEGLDGVVHLAGENIAAGRWTAEKKVRIRDSRVQGTRLLCETLGTLSRPPRVLVSASAVGYYGDRGDEILSEQSPSGTGFLADVCREWERATRPAVEKSVRVVLLRLGVVLSPMGGALARMLTPFKWGLGGKIGTGRQYMSWVSLDDVVGIIQHALSEKSLSGPVNAVAPNPVTNAEFTKTLGRVLSRPTIIPMPVFAARFAFGEMADALLLASTRVQAARLAQSGYRFHHPDLEQALIHLLHQERRAAGGSTFRG